MTILLFTDLDDTLFTSHRKALPDAAHRIAAILADGSPVSYASPLQQQWFAHWQRHAVIIPVTARNHAAFRRVQLPFTAHAVLNYGATILRPDGSPDEDWHAHSASCARDSAPRLQALAARLDDNNGDLNIRIITDYGIPFYLLIKSKSGAPLDETAAQLDTLRHPHDQLHHNGNNLALLPAWLNKSHAVKHLQAHYRAQHGTVLTLGMGDSLIDLAFMHTCDYLITPQTGQISAALYREIP